MMGNYSISFSWENILLHPGLCNLRASSCKRVLKILRRYLRRKNWRQMVLVCIMTMFNFACLFFFLFLLFPLALQSPHFLSQQVINCDGNCWPHHNVALLNTVLMVPDSLSSTQWWMVSHRTPNGSFVIVTPHQWHEASSQASATPIGWHWEWPQKAPKWTKTLLERAPELFHVHSPKLTKLPGSLFALNST